MSKKEKLRNSLLATICEDGKAPFSDSFFVDAPFHACGRWSHWCLKLLLPSVIKLNPDQSVDPPCPVLYLFSKWFWLMSEVQLYLQAQPTLTCSCILILLLLSKFLLTELNSFYWLNCAGDVWTEHCDNAVKENNACLYVCVFNEICCKSLFFFLVRQLS